MGPGNVADSYDVLVAGGGANLEVLQSAELYDPRTNSWRPAASMLNARSAAVGILLRSGHALVCGGDWFGTVLSSCELYHP